MSLHNLRGSNLVENYFRRSIFFQQRPSRVIVRIFSDTGYELFLNGRLAATLHEWANVRDYELSPFFQAGHNLIAVRAMNSSGHRGFACEVVVDGRSVLVTDKSWKCFPEERWGWMLPDFDDSAWSDSLEMDLSAAGAPQWWTLPGSDSSSVIPTLDCSPFFTGAIPKCVDSPFFTTKRKSCTPAATVLEVGGPEYEAYLAEQEPVIRPAEKILELRENDGTISGSLNMGLTITAPSRYTGPSLIVDLGIECVGYFRMKLQSTGAVNFRLYHAETMAEATSEISRNQLQNKMLREEYRVESGTREFEQRMRFGGRFLRVEFFDSPQVSQISDFSFRTCMYSTTKRGFFSCDDPELNQLWRMAERTLHLCMQEYYIDAPKRDRFLWVGDTRFQALYNYYLFADTALFEYCWDEMARVQYPDGAIPSAYGQGLSVLWDYVAWYVIAFQDYYLHTGKTEFLLKHKRTIEQAVHFLSSKAGTDGLIDIPDNPLGDLWMVVLNRSTGKDTLLNQLYLRALNTAKLVATIARDEERIQRYAAQIAFVSPAVSALSEAVPLEACKNNWFSSIMLYEIVEERCRTQNIAAGLTLLREKWKLYATSGFSTFGEGFYEDSVEPIAEIHDSPSYLSYCHGWTAAPLVFLPVWIAGLRPLEPGWKKVQIAPAPCGLQEFRTVIPTPQGEIALCWQREMLTIVLPPECTAEVIFHGKHFEAQAGVAVFR